MSEHSTVDVTFESDPSPSPVWDVYPYERQPSLHLVHQRSDNLGLSPSKQQPL